MCKFRRKKSPQKCINCPEKEISRSKKVVLRQRRSAAKKYPVILVRLIFAQNMRLPTKKNQHNFGLVGRSMRKLYCMCRFHYRPAKNSSRAVSILICMAFLMNCICRLLVCLPVPSLHDRIIQKFIVNFVYTCTKLSQPPKVNNHKLFQ